MDDGLEDDLGFDSLEKLRLAASVNEMFHLHEVGCEDSLLTDATFGAWIDRVEAAWHSGVASVTFTTSGTTGRPKRCSHDAVHLRTEIAFLADLFRDRQRIVSLVPTHHVYGFLFCALLPDALAIQHLDATLFSPGRWPAPSSPAISSSRSPSAGAGWNDRCRRGQMMWRALSRLPRVPRT